MIFHLFVLLPFLSANISHSACKNFSRQTRLLFSILCIILRQSLSKTSGKKCLLSHTGEETDTYSMGPLSFNGHEIFHIECAILQGNKKEVEIERWCYTNVLFWEKENVSCKQTAVFSSLQYFALDELWAWSLVANGFLFSVDKNSHQGWFLVFPT